ncbi:MAG TPA: AraC family transcriptional regulator [Pyrinomonadaceae bacterium]|nr:AraC family transcriptional regulator [Pyrinomonadaceae bacterium]
MRYREITPSPALTPYIECFWTLERDATAEQAEPERILPDGCVELILNFGDRFRALRDNGSQEDQPNFFMVGQMTKPMLIVPSGGVEIIGIRFHPGGTLPFFKNPMNELTNEIVEIGALSNSFESELINDVGEFRTLSEKVSRLDELLVSRASTRTESSLRLLVNEIVARAGQVTVEELATTAGISNRQLARRFLSDVGLTPKLLCRILRFQQVFRALDRNDAGWSAIALDCGYYDQAHLIRDFQHFAGKAPALLLAQASPLTRSFTRKDRMSDFSNTTRAELH